jgi:hypothetical protein
VLIFTEINWATHANRHTVVNNLSLPAQYTIELEVSQPP